MTAAVLRWTAEKLKQGEPPWWPAVAKAWEKRRFVAWAEAWGLYLTALHFEALNNKNSPLVRFFPSCGGTAEADPASGLAKFFAAPPASFLENLRAGHRRAYVSSRSLLWIGPAMQFFQRRDLPFYLVEVNAGAGLNLAADQLFAPKGFDASLVTARVGLDERPLDLESIEDRRWLTACVAPDNAPAIIELDKAIEAVLKRTRQEAMFLQLAPCPAAKAPAFVAKNIPADPETGLLVYNMGTTVRMPDDAYAAYAKGLQQTLEPWGDRALWLEAETVRGELYSTTLQLRAHRVVGGALKTLVLGSMELQSGQAQLHPDADAFLGNELPPAAPKK